MNLAWLALCPFYAIAILKAEMSCDEHIRKNEAAMDAQVRDEDDGAGSTVDHSLRENGVIASKRFCADCAD